MPVTKTFTDNYTEKIANSPLNIQFFKGNDKSPSDQSQGKIIAFLDDS